MSEWYESIENLKNLANFIQHGLNRKLDAAYFLEKPWHYEEEWNEYSEQSWRFNKEESEKELKV